MKTTCPFTSKKFKPIPRLIFEKLATSVPAKKLISLPTPRSRLLIEFAGVDSFMEKTGSKNLIPANQPFLNIPPLVVFMYFIEISLLRVTRSKSFTLCTFNIKEI